MISKVWVEDGLDRDTEIGDYLESKGYARDKFIILSEKEHDYLPPEVLEWTDGDSDPDTYVMDGLYVENFIEHYIIYTIEY